VIRPGKEWEEKGGGRARTALHWASGSGGYGWPRARPSTLLLLIGYVCGGIVGCGDTQPPDSPQVEVRDSADVRIIAHGSSPFFDTVPRQPVLSIGREGDSDYEFFGIRQISPLGSGNVVVANGGTSELIFYGSDGSFLRRVGQRGEGPSEFGFLTTVYTRTEDTLAVMDPRRRRLVVFDSAGVFVRGEPFAADLTTAPPDGICVVPGLLGVLADGARLTRGWGCMQFIGSDGLRPTLMTLELVRGENRDMLGRYSSNTVWERGGVEPGRDSYALIPLGAVMSWAVGSDRVYLSQGVRYEVSVYDGSGSLITILREDHTPSAVTSSVRSAYLEARLEVGDTIGSDVPFPAEMGAYQRLVLSHEGELWAQWASRPSESMMRWTIWSSDGMVLRHIVLPDVRVEAVRGGRIYAHLENEVGIQTVVVLEVPGSS